LIVIPTTCGTGSEATTFATFYEGQKKRSADHPDLLPNHVFLDPLLLKTLPQTIKGHTLSDSFCHAIESYWNIHSTQISRQWASQAIHLIVENYFLFMKGHGKDEEALKASHLAGKAINLTKTTAAHALSYSMTSLYGIPHGQAAAISLPEFFVFHSKIKEETCQDERGVLFVRERMKELKTLLKVKTSEQAKKTLINIFKTFGLKTHLKELGIFDISPLMDYGLHPDRLKNNPRKITRADLEGLLKRIL
jgi:alcohol dehydrogenase class IV